MNWIKENKFLFGYLVVTALGVGALGFFLFTAKGKYDDAVTDYQAKASELNRLQRLPTFPNQKNLDRLIAQKTEVNTEVSTLAETLAGQQLPMEEMTPEGFQDKLKASVTAVRNKAGQGNPPVKLPDKFFMGFERYETTPPAKEAGGALGRELKAVEWIVMALIDNKVVELKSLNRDELPEEKGRIRQDKKGGRPEKAQTPEKAAKKADKKAEKNHVVEKHRLELDFITEQSRFRQVLNTIVGYKGQFFIPRYVGVKNEKDKGPARVSAADAAAAAAAAGATPGTPQTPTPDAAAVSTYIVGEEKVEVTLILEMVDFSEDTTK